MKSKYIFYKDTNILVVEDNPAFQKMARKYLIALGFHEENISIAGNGKIGLDMVKQAETKFEFFIIDLIMPEMNGIDFIKNIMKIDEYKTIPKLVLSTESDSNIILNAIEAGANSYLNKPYDSLALAKKLFQCILQK